MTNYIKLSDFLYIKDNALTEEFCNTCIEKFKKDPERCPGKTGGGYLPEIKQSTDLNISNSNNWKEEDSVFFESLHESFNEYIKLHCESIPWLNQKHFEDRGYQIQETLPGGFYKWHHDFCTDKNEARLLTFIWYLNTIDEGGYTEFIDGTMIKPETGKLLLFPATWTYYHQGTPPIKQKKYICTGWLYLDASFS